MTADPPFIPEDVEAVRFVPPETRHERMVAAAASLARQGFARIGWADVRDGKGPRRAWKSDATDDPALVPGLLAGARNALVIPTGRGIVIDIDEAEAWAELEAAGLPATLAIDSPTPGHGHVYGWVPADVDMTTIPGTFAGGEIRRHDPRTNTASMVLGPWARRPDGVYTPRGDERVIAELPASVIEYLIANAGRQSSERSTARGPADPGWTITAGRHDFLVSRARNLRGVGLTGERLLEELVRIDRERCSPPLQDVTGRGLDELRRIAGWTEQRITDDPPGVRLDIGSTQEPLDDSGGSGGGARMQFPTARELFSAVPAEPDWWWAGYGALGTIAELTGAAKRAGKTTFCSHLTRNVLDGAPFLGRATRRTRVVYLSEQPIASLRASFATAGLLERDDLRILTWSAAGGRPWRDVAAAAIDACEASGAGLLVVDTLPQWAGLRGEAENDAGAALEVIAPLQAAAGNGLGILVVRHDRKGGGEVGESARGSTAFGGAADVILQLRRGSPEERPTIRYLSALSRFPDTPAELVIELDIHSGGAAGMNYTVLGDVAAYAESEGKQAVLVALGDQELRRAEIESATGISGERLTALLGELVAAGYLERSGRGVKGDPQRFRRIVSIHSGAPPHYVRGAVPNGIEPAPAGADDEASVAPALFAPVPGNGADAHRIACRDYSGHASAHRWVGDGWVCGICGDAVPEFPPLVLTEPPEGTWIA